MNPAFLYAAILHVGSLIALTVLVGLGKISWAEGGPIIGGLVGVGVGVPLTPLTAAPAATVTPANQPPAPPAG